jgi:hypothetical protein
MRFALLILTVLAMAAIGCRSVHAADPAFAEVRLGDAAPSWSSGGQTNTSAFAGVNTGLPSWLRWALQPQAQAGGPGGSAWLADTSYRGVVWTVPLASSLLQPDDRLSFGFSLGRGFGYTLPGADLRDLGPLRSAPTTRLGAAIGYEVTPRLSLYVLFDHVTGGVGGLSREDEIANDLGMRMGLRF